ncbi:MAG: DUF2058 domain-containing protein [Deltaproteobacteria bacterium]|nr:DUF2058 domain-containing protein [Deltaproteobacteria bacterium]
MSLKEQMLKAGLITEKQARQVDHRQKVQTKKQGHAVKETRARESREEAQRQQREKQQRDRELMERQNQKRAGEEQVLGQKARQLTRLEKAYREGVLANWEGSRRYYYNNDGRVDFLMVSDETARKLEAGQAAIVRGPGSSPHPTILNAAALLVLREEEPGRVVTYHGA